MKVHPYGMAIQGIGPDHPIDHDVNVELLTNALRAVALPAIEAGNLSCYTALDRSRWVSRVQIAAAVGFGRKLNDPASLFFVHDYAMLNVTYLSEPVTEAIATGSWYQRRVLETAQHAANYLAALKAVMPPRPYDIHVHWTADKGSPLIALVEAGIIQTRPSDCGWWLMACQVRDIMPAAEDLDNPSSDWYVDVHNRADHDEVDRLTAKHRRRWPEIYNRTPTG